MHRDAVLARLRIILAAPDIDLDVFRTQLEVIGPLSPPMTVLVSRDDVALSLSSTLAGARQRLGIVDVSDPRVQAAALKANLQIVDITQLKASDEFNHDRFVSLAADYHRITATANAGGSDLRHAGAYVFDSVGATLASPFNLAGTALLGK
jgi:esterase/lipase superfamily enzyme